MTQKMTVREMRSQIMAYKKKNCPPLPTTKKGCEKVMDLLGLKSSKPDLKMIKKMGLTVPKKMKGVPVWETMSKPELIRQITAINNRPASVYAKWSREDLKNFLQGGL
jgi:hypothetical protein